MADLSLDQYIARGQGSRPLRGGLSQRLGPKGGGRGRGTFNRGRGGRGGSHMVGGRGQQQFKTQFNVVGLGKVQGFDARQRLTNQPVKNVPDARQKILQKTKFVDARNRIEIKKATGQAIDVRNKIETNKAKKVDARERIKARQNNQNAMSRGSVRQQVLVTGLGQTANTNPSFNGRSQQAGQQMYTNQTIGAPQVVASAAGTLKKTIKNRPIAITPITGPSSQPKAELTSNRPLIRTVNNDMAMRGTLNSTQSGTRSMMSKQPLRKPGGPVRSQVTGRHPGGAANNGLLITTKNRQAMQPQIEYPSSSGSGISLRGIQSPSAGQWLGTESSMRSAPYHSHTGTAIRVKNELFEEALDDMGTESSMRSAPYYSHTGTAIRVKNDLYEEDQEDMELEPVRRQVPMARVQKPQMIRLSKPKIEAVEPFQPTTVRAAIQRASAQQSTAKNTWEDDEDYVPVSDIVSPLQGFRVLVTNLHPIVTEDDIVELFGAVGALKRARLMKPGVAEVVFVKKDEALVAVRKYHLRELDGQPMQLALSSQTSPQNAPVKASPIRAPAPIPTPVAAEPLSATGPLRLGKPTSTNTLMETQTKKSVETGMIDPGLIHKALFRGSVKDDGPNRPVTFTVKI